jgi:dihydrofolate synthase/folylpolyglutamate synthase
MTYSETLDYLFNQLPMYQRVGKAAYKADLNNTIQLDKYLDHPHKAYKTIHVAGTNGKGSVSHTLASILQEAGYKVGLYTSPHYIDFRERIKINGQMIDKNFIISFVEKNKNFFDKIKPSFFEITNAMAFEYFKSKNIQIAVIEVGMGGRLDSTNIITPELSIITNIGYDHTQFLGNTLEAIASEKAGIIKKNVPVVIGETKASLKYVFSKKAQQLNAPIFFTSYVFNVRNFIKTNSNTLIFNIEKHGNIEYTNLEFALCGEYQKLNVPTILLATEILKNKFNISKDNIYDGFKNVIKNTGIMGRWQTLMNKPTVICDAAHNADGIKQISEQLQHTKYNKIHFIYGCVNDKDLSKILKLLPKKAKYYFTKAKIPRALDEKILKNSANNTGLYGDSFQSVDLAINAALNNAKTNDLIFIGGSTFVAAEAIEFFMNTKNT